MTDVKTSNMILIINIINNLDNMSKFQLELTIKIAKALLEEKYPSPLPTSTLNPHM